MSRLISSAFQIRNDPRLLKAPPYLSLGCIVFGVAWLLLLPLDDYSRRTYISENALLPGQVHTYFSGSDQHVFRAYKSEVVALSNEDNYVVNDRLESIAHDIGLKTARQNFSYSSAGETYAGENLYAILQAPRGDATEAIVLIASWRNEDGELNKHGVPLALTLARYFKRWSLWSKDIILLFPPESTMGSQAWADAYHDAHDTANAGSLPIKAGLLQGAIAIDYPQEERFESVHIVYDGTNGQLPNLDLINSIVSISNGQLGFQSNIQKMWDHSDSYDERLKTMFRGMVNQGLGHATGPHSAFIPYHVDAVTLRPYGAGWQDEMAMGRLIEGSFRSLNNLLEHLHQSFFFYLLMNRGRFVSIGTYLPSAMILAANFTIMAIAGWVQSGQAKNTNGSPATLGKESQNMEEVTQSQEANEVSVPLTSTPPSSSVPSSIEREVSLPLAVVISIQSLGFVPLYLFNNTPVNMLYGVFLVFSVVNCALPFIISSVIASYQPTLQQFQIIKSFSLLGLGMFLSALATLNFSLAFFVGLFSAPFSFARPLGKRPSLMVLFSALLNLLAPCTLLFAGSSLFGVDMSYLLKQAAFGWDVWGMYTSVVVWCVWWPAWLVASLVVLANPASQARGSQ
ncbi:GPI transamidase component GAA1 [Ceratocystis fimbriata CBS 114723]|uniref:GPI transamidase component GAA1 n=1 Tax=Ceratocystis fimbriata CBS 114723 TaxID=1035309 RepID=A0A2C5XB86_9PEZI|nr:GPI transamidase component GAA1 [Ceratocystis fimbriata CBS 114723]